MKQDNKDRAAQKKNERTRIKIEENAALRHAQESAAGQSEKENAAKPRSGNTRAWPSSASRNQRKYTHSGMTETI